MNTGITATAQSVTILITETAYVKAIMMDWSIHVPRAGFHDAATGLHRTKTAEMATRVAMTDTATSPQRV
jgi:hypothetical protein